LRTIAVIAAAFLVLFALVSRFGGPAAPVYAVEASDAPPAPEFTHSRTDDWINSEPLIVADLRGQVILLDFWTFDCWNCYRSIPWLKEVESRFHEQGLRVIGVHSPELEHEKVRDNVVRKVAEFGLEHPVMIDNDFSYWRAFRNRYWPAFYLIDKQGRVRALYVGETHSGDSQARRIEQEIEALLAEPS
jgi:thiol-disulfide isomerase/thioredoxin